MGKGILLRIDRSPEDPELCLGDMVAIFNIQAQSLDDGFFLQRLPATHIGRIGERCDFSQFIEPCSGMGALSLGAMELGFFPCAAMDISPLSVEVYAMNHEAPCLLGNLLDGQDLWHLFESVGGQRVGLAAGFPCPPFSAMGDRLGFKDSRASVFIQCLNVGYLFGCSFAVLECTPHTGEWAEVRDCLASFARAMGMDYHTGILNLQRSWPCRRTRWWAVLFPCGVRGSFPPLRDLPRLPELQDINAIVPEWPCWPDADVAALRWMEHENHAYRALVADEDVVLQMNGQCPTLLHSAGHHFMGCPCGCRSGPLSQHRLQRDGVSTVAVRLEGGLDLRHLHPSEAAYFSTVWANFKPPPGDLRQLLPLIGQLAAPLQSHWIFGQLKAALLDAHLIQIDAEFDIFDRHMQFLDKLQRSRYHFWPVPSMALPREITIDGGEHVFTFPIGSFARVKHLLHAQLQLNGWGSRLKLRHQGVLLEDDCYLHALTYNLDEYVPAQLMPLIEESFTLQIWHNGI